MFRRMFVVLAVLLFGVTAAAAQSCQDTIDKRQALMKRSAEMAKAGASMIKGDTPFDLAKVKEILAAFADDAAAMPTLFPDCSKTGGDTAADPKIWENMADFKARFQKFGDDAKAADASVTDLDSFKAAIGNIGKNDCGGCHQNYRIKKS